MGCNGWGLHPYDCDEGDDVNTMTEWPLPPVPSTLPYVGTVIAAIPTHRPVSETDPASWVIMCDRGAEYADMGRFCTNTLQGRNVVRQGEPEYLATNGHYDLTYDEAYDDLLLRAGITNG